MRSIALDIPAIKLITPKIMRDDRGFFSETWNGRTFHEAGITGTFVQDNHALSRQKGTVRGLHFQTGPMAQDKLVRCVRGAILDVAVDLRRSSTTFGRHVRAVLSAENWTQIWVPKGFAHGYVTLEPDTEVVYKVTEYYSPSHDRGLLWDDPALAIEWGITRATALVSDKDKMQPKLQDVDAGFP